MNWLKRSKSLFPSKKKILLTNFCNATNILDVEECQSGMIVKRNMCDDSYLILEAGGTVHGDRTYHWFPHSGFTQESIIQDMIFRTIQNEKT